MTRAVLLLTLLVLVPPLCGYCRERPAEVGRLCFGCDWHRGPR